MKLKYNFVTNRVADSIVAVAVGDSVSQFNGFIKMNDTGAEIFELLKSDIAFEDLVSKMQDSYPQDGVEKIRESVVEFVKKLAESGVLEQ